MANKKQKYNEDSPDYDRKRFKKLKRRDIKNRRRNKERERIEQYDYWIGEEQ